MSVSTTLAMRAHNMPRVKTAAARKKRFQDSWSLLCGKLGGQVHIEHPNLRLIEHYLVRAPWTVESREWAKFMRWYKDLYREIWFNGGASWQPKK